MAMKAQKPEKTATIIGGCGFIGSALVSRLLEQEGEWSEVAVVDDLSSGRAELIPVEERVRFIRSDAADFELRSVGPSAVIFYLAAAPFVPSSFIDPAGTWERNVNVLDAFLRRNRLSRWPPLVYASSAEVYGEVSAGGAGEGAAKTEPDAKMSPYAASRIEAERVLISRARKQRIPAWVMRLFNVVGPRATHPYFVPDMIRQVEHNGVVRHGELSTVRDFVWIGDSVEALVAAARSNRAGVTAINVASGVGWPMSEVLDLVIEACGSPQARRMRDPRRVRPVDIRRLVGDPARARAVLGWRATVGLREAVLHTVRWYRRSGRWPYEDKDELRGVRPLAAPSTDLSSDRR